MEFTLHYRGPLPANGDRGEKQRLRRYFHPQLRNLWAQPPLDEYRDLLEPPEGDRDLSVRCEVGRFTFVPLVSSNIAFVAELDITMLRPEPPGSIITQGGDIDNRLKTLLDALKAPDQESALPDGDTPAEDETPFFCLLEDDNLVTRLSVATDRLLEPTGSDSEVVLLIRVRTRALRWYTGTKGLV